MTTKPVIPVLESGMNPTPGQVYRLYEAGGALEIVRDPYIVERVSDPATGGWLLVEKKVNEDDRMVIRGVFQRSDVQNANRRVYPRTIWEKWTSPDSDLMRRIKERQCVGQIEHPKDGVGSLKEAAILVTGLTLQKDGTVIGEAEVLDTPSGRVVRDLLRSGVKIGVSSRGTGTVDARGTVDEKTFKCETWDVVGNPSTPGAFPQVVEKPAIAESLNEASKGQTVRVSEHGGKTRWTVLDEATGKVVRQFEAATVIPTHTHGDSAMSAKNKFDTLRTQVDALVASQIHEAAVADLNTLDKALVEASVAAETLIGEDGTLKPVISTLQERIAEKRKSIQQEIDEKKSAKPKIDERGKGCAREEDEDDDMEEGEEGDDPQTLEEALETLAKVRPLLIELAEKVEAQDQLIESMATDLAERETTIEELTESLAAANATIAEMTGTGKPGVETVAEAVEEAIKTNPALEESRPFLERCTSVEEVRTLSERLVPGQGNRPARSTFAGKNLPPIGGNANSVNEQKTTTGAVNESTRPAGNGTASKSRGAALVKQMLERSTPAKKPQING